jgi:hypothetical protein
MARKRRKPTGCNHDLFTDFPMSKTHLSDVLGVTRSTVYLWSDLCFWRLPSFREAYPKKSDGSFDRESPLSPYQCWVIARIGRLINQLASSERVKTAIKTNPNYFSLYTYRNALKNLTKIGA